MSDEVTILTAEDDHGHAMLIQRNLKRAGITNPLIHFPDGQAILDFFWGEDAKFERGKSYLVLLDIRMPKVDGIEVLKRLKENELYRRIPVIMLTTTEDPKEVEMCHDLGCNSYVVKPVDYEKFVQAIRNLGLFLTVVKVPLI